MEMLIQSMNQNATVATADERETLLDNFLRAGSIKFTPRENFAGDLIGVDGIMVEAISTVKAEGCGDALAPKGVNGDADPKYGSEFHCCRSVDGDADSKFYSECHCFLS